MIEFEPTFTQPRLMLSLVPLTTAEKPPSWAAGADLIQTETATRRLSLFHRDVFAPPVSRGNDRAMTIVFGSPIINDAVDREGVLKGIAAEEGIDANFVRGLNGEFLILHFDKASSSLFVVNDRFASWPFYYAADDDAQTFHGSHYFADMWDLSHQARGDLDVNEEAFFEFLWFQRLIGTKTYLRDVHFLPDASILTVRGGKPTLDRHWQRNYRKSHRHLDEHAGIMADLVRQAIRRKTSDGKRYGHFLSGGMDSRTILAGFEDNLPTCFTVAFEENREFRRAREIALAKGAEHVGLRLDPELYGHIMGFACRAGGGMYALDHGIFLGFNDAVRQRADVAFHGHGFDYMFQGMYVPGRNVVIGGRTLYLRMLVDLPDDLAGHFIANASYRTKRADVMGIVKPERRDELLDSLRAGVEAVLKRGEALTDNPNDLFEYLTFHHLSRHYSYPNHASLETFIEQRVISFDNDLFNLYLALPREHRFNGKIEKMCLKILDPKLAKIWSANTNLPVTASCWTQTLHQLAGFVKRRIIPKEDKPEWRERTWPARGDALRGQKKFKRATLDLIKSDALERLSFLDLDKLRDHVPRWLDGEEFEELSGDCVMALLSVGGFLKGNRG